MNAPERIWAWKEFDDDPRRKTWDFFWTPQSDGHPDLTEYVRADLIEAQAAQLQEAREELQGFLDGCDASRWHDRAGERVKTISVAPSKIDRVRALLAKSQ